MGILHTYEAAIIWTGAAGVGTTSYTSYSRDHDVLLEGKPPLPGSSDPGFRGDPSRYCPEELMVAALAQCHMLWVLHLDASDGVVVVGYSDRATGRMRVEAAGHGQFTEVVLRPCVTIAHARDVAGAHPERRCEEPAGMAALDLRDGLRCPLGDHPATTVTALGPQVHHPVGALDHIQVVLDHDHGVALVHQRLEHSQQPPDVLEVQAGGRLVQHVHRASGRPLLQLARELDALRLATGEGGRRLTKADVAEADVHQRLEVPGDRRHRGEELRGLLDRHVQHIRDGLALEVHLQGLPVVPGAVAHLARHVHVGQEVHLDLDRAVT